MYDYSFLEGGAKKKTEKKVPVATRATDRVSSRGIKPFPKSFDVEEEDIAYEGIK